MERIEQAEAKSNPCGWHADGAAEVAQHLANECMKLLFV
jgi:hypothetical protein